MQEPVYTFSGLPAKKILHEGELWLAVKMSDVDNVIYKTHVVISKTQETQ